MSESNATPSLNELAKIIHRALNSNMMVFVDGEELDFEEPEVSCGELNLRGRNFFETIMSVSDCVDDGYLAINEEGVTVHITFCDEPTVLPLQTVLDRLQQTTVAGE